MASSPGAFGKIPALGDFFRLRTSSAFVGAWDPWLQAIMLDARRALGPRWDDIYLTMPVWRFCLPPDMAGPTAMAGVLMPSIDRVGRQFPLTLLSELPAARGFDTLKALFDQHPMLDRLEAIALDALDDEMSRDALDALLSAVVPAPVSAPGPALRRSLAGGVCMSGSQPDQLATDLAVAALQLGRSAVWSCTVDSETRLVTTARLPQGAEALGLFDLDAEFWAEPAE
jgi:type VI secretion system protein ImpM